MVVGLVVEASVNGVDVPDEVEITPEVDDMLDDSTEVVVEMVGVGTDVIDIVNVDETVEAVVGTVVALELDVADTVLLIGLVEVSVVDVAAVDAGFGGVNVVPEVGT